MSFRSCSMPSLEAELLDEIFLAGERVKAGVYRRVGSAQELRVNDGDMLPASLDGRVAVYVRAAPTWNRVVTSHAVTRQSPNHMKHYA